MTDIRFNGIRFPSNVEESELNPDVHLVRRQNVNDDCSNNACSVNKCRDLQVCVDLWRAYECRWASVSWRAYDWGITLINWLHTWLRIRGPCTNLQFTFHPCRDLYYNVKQKRVTHSVTRARDQEKPLRHILETLSQWPFRLISELLMKNAKGNTLLLGCNCYCLNNSFQWHWFTLNQATSLQYSDIKLALSMIHAKDSYQDGTKLRMYYSVGDHLGLSPLSWVIF